MANGAPLENPKGWNTHWEHTQRKNGAPMGCSVTTHIRGHSQTGEEWHFPWRTPGLLYIVRRGQRTEKKMTTGSSGHGDNGEDEARRWG